jgi:hypothetical protein
MATQSENKRTLLCLSNRWVNSIYSGYGILKQRIFLQIIEQLQKPVWAVKEGTPVSKLKIWDDHYLTMQIDMSKICHYNNYFYVRKALREMVKQPIQISDQSESFPKHPTFQEQPLLAGTKTKAAGKIAEIRINRDIAEKLVHIMYGKLKSGKMGGYNFTSFDKDTCRNSSSKYMMPLYMMVCGFAENGSFTIGIDQLRTQLQVEEKYAGFDNFNRFILQHVQKELTIFGKYCFNFSVKKTGKSVTQVIFKIFENKQQVDNKHHWIRIQKMFDTLPQFRPFTYEQREQFNYLLTSNYELQEVHKKFEHIHKALVRRKETGQQTRSAFAYTYKAIAEQFPPPG